MFPLPLEVLSSKEAFASRSLTSRYLGSGSGEKERVGDQGRAGTEDG